jgi:hypothetical protein
MSKSSAVQCYDPKSARSGAVPPVGVSGTVYFDTDSKKLFISDSEKWIPIGDPSSSQSRSISSSVQATLVQAFKTMTLPTVQNILTTPLSNQGCVVYEGPTGKLFYSTTTAWVELLTSGGGSVTLNSVGTGVSLVNNPTSPNLLIKSLISGVGASVTSNFANTEVTISGNYVAGTNVSIVGNVISATGALGVTLVSANPDGTIVVDNTNPAMPIVGGNYQGSSNISIVGNVISTTALNLVESVTANPDGTIVVDNTDPANPIVGGNYQGSANISIVGNVISTSALNIVESVTANPDGTIVVDNTDPANPIVGGNYQPGTNISIVGNTISTSALNIVESVTANPDGTIIVDNTDPANPIVGGNYQPGTNITIVGNTINASGALGVNSVTANPDGTVIVDNTDPANPIVGGGYVGGTNIAIVGNAISITGIVGAVNGGTGNTTPYANGQLLIGNGTTLTKANLTAGSGISVVNGVGTITLSVDPAGVVTTFSAGTTGLLPSVATSGAIVLTGTLIAANGGTGNTTPYANGQLLIGNGTTLTKATLTAGSGITITNGAGTITIAASAAAGVSSFSAGTTGLTPNVATTGAVVLAGTLIAANGGTGNTTPYANGQLLIGNGTTLTKANLTAGTGITVTNGVGSITVVNSSPASSVTLAGTGAGTTLVSDGVGPALGTKDLTAGTGISVTGGPTSVAIGRTAVGFSAQMTNGASVLVASGAVINTAWSLTFGSGFVPASGLYTVPVTGLYLITFAVCNTTQDSFVAVRINGAAGTVIMCANVQAATNANQSMGSRHYQLTAASTIGLYNASGGARTYINPLASGTNPMGWFGAYYIGA